MRLRYLGTALAMLAVPSPALVQPAAQACTAADAALPASLAGWRAPGGAIDGTVRIGEAARLALAQGARFPVMSRRDSEDGDYGGSVSFTIRRPGTYEIALSHAAWIDVVHDGVASASVAHRHGPPCSTIRKIVSFPLAQGTYHLQITGSPAPEVRLMIVEPAS